MNRLSLIALTLLFTGLSASALQAQDLTLRLAHVQSTNEPMHEAALRFAELVESKSDGNINVEIFPSGQLGANLDVYEQVRMGSPVIQISDPGYLSDYQADFGILNGPYLLDDPADFNKLLMSDWYDGLTEDLANNANLRVLALNWLFGSRHVIANQPVKSLEDFAGLSIRVPPNVMWIETFKALGARGETLAWPEVYSGLASGVVDAAEAPLTSLYGSKIYESAKTISMTGHFTAFVGPIISEDLFQTLSPEMQTVLLSAATEAGEYMTEVTLGKTSEVRADLEAEGVEFVDDVDLQEFRDATRIVYDQFPEWSEGLYDNVQSILNQE